MKKYNRSTAPANKGMHPTADTHHFMNFESLGAAGDAGRYAALLNPAMRKITILIFTASLILGLNAGCNFNAPAGCQQLCSLPEGQQHQTFKSFPVEKQVDLYLGCKAEKSCWRDSVSPQDDFGRWMAEDDKAASFLTERLKAEKGDDNKRKIIYVLRLMAVNGHLKGQRHIAEAVNRVAAELEDGDERAVKQARSWAKEVEGNTQ